MRQALSEYAPSAVRDKLADGTLGIEDIEVCFPGPTGTKDARAVLRRSGWPRLAFTSNRDGTPAIYVMDADGTGVTRLTEGHWPAWSPDGLRLAFSNAGIYVMNTDGTGVTRLTDHAGDLVPAWSPDGSRIVFQTDRDGAFDIYLMGADGSGLVNITNHNEVDVQPAWLPNGSQIAFSSNRVKPNPFPGNYEIFVMNADGTGVARLTTNPAREFWPRWRP